jgi:hypothetical protein
METFRDSEDSLIKALDAFVRLAETFNNGSQPSLSMQLMAEASRRLKGNVAGDIAAGHFIYRSKAEGWQQVPRYTKDAAILYHGKDWPNVRE